MKNTTEINFTDEQIQEFEYASQLEGFTSLSEYILYALEEQSKLTRIKFGAILATPRDKKIFFDTVENPREPNDALKEAYKKRKDFFEDDELDNNQ